MEVQLETLAQSATGASVGSLWIEIDEVGFPERGWSDFPVIVLRWWALALSTLSAQESKRAELSFMDSPFSLRIDALPESRNLVQLRGSTPAAQVEATLELDQLAAAVREAASLVLNASREAGWDTADLKALGRAF